MMIQKRGDVDDGVSLLLQRRIQFHPARKPLKPFSANSISNSSFHLETLNPSYYNNQRTSISNSSSASAEQVKDHYTNSPSPVIDPELCFNMSVRRIGAGLENLGNTCYLNSVLQCLTYTEPFAAYLQSGKHKSSCHTAGFCAMCAIQNHVKRALQSSGRILAPNDLVRNLRCISRTFGKARQEDAHEYMVNLLESMHKCCLPSGMPSESPSAYEISLVHKIFGGRLRSQSDSLHKALSHFTAIEQLDGGGRQYQCERCKQKVKALKQLTVDKAPYVLSIHLKRFGSHAPGQKIDKKVEFGPTLDLKPFVSNSNDVDLKYTLYGVLVHAGWSSHSGHYFCFVRTSSGMWHSLDDNRVVQVSERTVMQQKAYMLFYVRDRKIPAPKKQIVRKESLPSDHEKGDMFASVNQKKTFQSALVAARLHTLDSFKKPQVKESCILNIPKSSVMAGAFSHLKDPTSQSSLKVLVNDCAVEQQPNCPSAELHAGSTLSSIVINNVNLQNDYEVERPSNEHSLQKAIDNGLPSMVCDREEQFIKTCKRNKCVQKALTDNNNLPKVLKPKKKVMKLRVASVHLGSRFMIKAMLSSYKKNKKQKTNKCQRLKVKSLIGEKYKKYSVSESLEPSASVKKKLRDLVSTHSERSRKNSCLASGSLSESFCENGSDVDLKYTLYGVLVHAGWSSHSGHYFCFVRTSSGMWHSLDDNRVVQVSERTVMQQKAYMLFYVRDRKIPAPKKQIVRKESLPSDHEKGDMFASVNQKKTFQSALVAARLHTLDSFKKPQVKESCILNIPKSSVMAGAFSHLKDPTSQSSLKVLVNDCAVEQQPNCPSAELHAGSTLSSIVINNVNLQNDYEVERPSNEHSLQKAIDNGLPSMVCDREEQFIKTCKRNKCVQKALTDNNNLPKVLKPKKKVMKLRVASVHLGSRFMIKAMLSSYKKNKKQKTNKCQRLKVKSLIGEKYKKYSVSESLEPSASVKKKLRDLVSTHSERSRKNSCLASGSLSESFCENGSVSMLTRGIEEFTVARWDEAETSPSEIVVPEKGQDITIGYVPDEWDEEYDRGKRKKVRNPKDSFSGSNPFQELATKKAKLRNVEVGRTASSKKQPLRRK